MEDLAITFFLKNFIMLRNHIQTATKKSGTKSTETTKLLILISLSVRKESKHKMLRKLMKRRQNQKNENSIIFKFSLKIKIFG